MSLNLLVLGRKFVAIGLLLTTVAIDIPLARATGPVTVGGPFTLTAPDGTTVTDQTYRGKWLLVYFGYTSCPDTCPTTLDEVASVLRSLGPGASEIQPIFITIDPQRDTPHVMGDYAQSFDARIVGLTGTSDQIDAVIKAYGAYVVRQETGPDGAYLMDHSTYLYLMSPHGAFIRAFDTHWSSAEIASAIRDVVKRYPGRSAEYTAQTTR